MDLILIPAETTLEGLLSKSETPLNIFEKEGVEVSVKVAVPSATIVPTYYPNNK